MPAWLLDGRVQVQTEALIMAAQDGVILTGAYRNRVMGKAVSLVCRVCVRVLQRLLDIFSPAAYPCSGRSTKRDTTECCIRWSACLPSSTV